MAKTTPIPTFHDLPLGCEIADASGTRYRVVGRRRVPMSDNGNSWTRLVISFRRLRDGETRDLGEYAHPFIAAYYPPARTRERTRGATA